MNNLLKIWNQNKPVVNAWLSIPNSFTAEAANLVDGDSIPLPSITNTDSSEIL